MPCSAARRTAQHSIGQHSIGQHSGPVRCNGMRWSAMQSDGVQCGAGRGGGTCSRRRLTRRWPGIMPMAGGEKVAGNSPLRLHEASRRAANISPALCSGDRPCPVQWSSVQCSERGRSGVQCRAMKCGEMVCGAAAIARCNSLIGDGRRIMISDCAQLSSATSGSLPQCAAPQHIAQRSRA
jgi:hypothetical protein